MRYILKFNLASLNYIRLPRISGTLSSVEDVARLENTKFARLELACLNFQQSKLHTSHFNLWKSGQHVLFSIGSNDNIKLQFVQAFLVGRKLYFPPMLVGWFNQIFKLNSSVHFDSKDKADLEQDTLQLSDACKSASKGQTSFHETVLNTP